MRKLILLLFIPLFFSCNESTKSISEYELIENWAKIPDDYIFGNPTGVALKSNQNLVVREKVSFLTDKVGVTPLMLGGSFLHS